MNRLQFTKEEKKINSLEQKKEKISKKLNKARQKQPTREIEKKIRTFDEKNQKPETKFIIEKEVIPINEAKWNKPKKKFIPRKATSAVGMTAVNKLHSKIYEVEHENVGTQTAHRAELVGESVIRGGKRLAGSAYRFVRNSPYRQVSKLEQQSIKTDMKLSYQKALKDNPQLKSNPISRFFQKRNIRKQYAESMKTAKNSAKTTKKAVNVIQKAAEIVTGIVRKNPVAFLYAGALLLIIFAVMSCFSMCGTIISGTSAFTGATSYAADDESINQVELSYTEWETDLLLEVQNAESTHSGYDEYRYTIGNVGHNPLELMAFLTAVYEDFTYGDVESVLRSIFDEQYQLAFTPLTEIRTRMESRTGYYADTNENVFTYTYEVEVEYEWRILTVTLTSKPFSAIISSLMTEEQAQHYTLLMQSRRNRQYIGNPFEFDVLPNVTSYFGYRIHPITGVKNYHKGLDIAIPEGTEIHAGIDGTVTIAAYDSSYGNYIVIKQRKDDGTVIEAKYAHCHTLTVTAGQEVKTGDIIATVGTTGDSTGNHLHLEIVKNGIYQNPIYFTYLK